MYWMAFYRGRGRFFTDTIPRIVTQSEFSHCELLRSDTEPQFGETHLCGSASVREGGVRAREITFREGRWEFCPVPWAPENAWDVIGDNAGRRYDLLGLAMTHFFNFRIHSKSRWFCSEICAHALGLSSAHSYAPGDLHRIVKEMNVVFARGCARR
ncbi:MAG: hypothetical protein AAF376_07200 [Pseudomonadota bacterium]